jgi:tetratricopeptide (TPR) repeat protein
VIQGEAKTAVERLEQLDTRRLKPNLQLQQRYLLGWASYKVTQYQESEYILSEAEQIAKELHAHYLHLHILHQLALTYAAMRNYAQALLAHQRCLNQIAESEIQDPFFTARIYIQMGQDYTRLDNFEQSHDMFHQALSIMDGLSTAQGIQAAYSSLCQQYAAVKDYELATLYAYKSIQLHNQEVIKRLQSELYHYLGRAILQQSPQAARAYLDEVLPKHLSSQDTLTQASLLACNAEWYFTQEELNEAEKYANQAYELARLFGDTVITANTLIVLGRIEYAEQRHDEGSQHFVAGLDMLERLENHEELADESVRYAQLLEETGNAHEAFTHIRRAYQSRQKLGK